MTINVVFLLTYILEIPVFAVKRIIVRTGSNKIRLLIYLKLLLRITIIDIKYNDQLSLLRFKYVE